jgi:Cu-processing system ATP-binding protein
LGQGGLTLTCAQTKKLALLARITALGDQIADIDIQPPSLEDIYSHFSKRAGQ